MAWKDLYIASLKPGVADRDEYDDDGRGLGVRVRKSGTITWLFSYSYQKQQKVITLGIYRKGTNPLVTLSLAEARRRVDKARALLVDGIDPATNKHLFDPSVPPPSTALLEENVYSVSTLIDDYLKYWASEKVERSRKEDERLLRKYIQPEWGGRAVASILRTEAVSLVQNIATISPGEARNVTRVASTMWTYASFVVEKTDKNPFQKIGLKVPKARVGRRERTLTDGELKFVWSAISSTHGYSLVRRALKLVMLLALRPGEVVQLCYEWIDDRGEWLTIPWEFGKVGRNKNIANEKKYDHRVYLPPLARELIGTGKGYVFPGKTGHLAEQTLSQYVRKELSKGAVIIKSPYFGLPVWRPNDLRRTAATKLAELGAPHEHIDAIQWHLIPGVAGIYIKYKYDAQKREWLSKLDAHLQQLVGMGDSLGQTIADRTLDDHEIRVIWQSLNNRGSTETARCLRLILITGQSPGKCAAMHSSDITTDNIGSWWAPGGSNSKIFLTPLALQIVGSAEGYAFASKGSHIQVGTLSYLGLRSSYFGLDKWLPDDLRNTAVSRISGLGAPSATIDAILSGGPANQWELKHWFERWEQQLRSIVE